MMITRRRDREREGTGDSGRVVGGSLGSDSPNLEESASVLSAPLGRNVGSPRAYHTSEKSDLFATSGNMWSARLTVHHDCL